MTWIDPIVEEVRRVRHEYAAGFNFDLDAIYQDLKAKEAASGRPYVDLSGKQRPAKSAGQQKQQPPRS